MNGSHAGSFPADGGEPRLDRRWYRRAADELAAALLGQVLVRNIGGERLAGIIVETEAYLGPHDGASHTRRGLRTPRNESMWLGGGHAYVYFVYGMHHCFNVVAGAEGSGAAVLIRAIRPLEGTDRMRRHRIEDGLSGAGGACGGASSAMPDERLANGPAKLAQAMAIDRTLDGVDLCDNETIWIERGRADAQIRATPRIGVEFADLWAAAPLRFVVPEASRWLSRRLVE